MAVHALDSSNECDDVERDPLAMDEDRTTTEMTRVIHFGPHTLNVDQKRMFLYGPITVAHNRELQAQLDLPEYILVENPLQPIIAEYAAAPGWGYERRPL